MYICLLYHYLRRAVLRCIDILFIAKDDFSDEEKMKSLGKIQNMTEPCGNLC